MDRLYFIEMPRLWIERHRQILQRVIVIAGVLLASAYLARKPSQLYIVLPLAPIVILVLFRYRRRARSGYPWRSGSALWSGHWQ